MTFQDLAPVSGKRKTKAKISSVGGSAQRKSPRRLAVASKPTVKMGIDQFDIGEIHQKGEGEKTAAIGMN